MNEDELKDIARLMALACVRNTVIENYQLNGQLSDEDMKVFNQQVVNNIYTFLHFLNNVPTPEREGFLQAWSPHFPKGWDEPEFSEQLSKCVQPAENEATRVGRESLKAQFPWGWWRQSGE